MHIGEKIPAYATIKIKLRLQHYHRVHTSNQYDFVVVKRALVHVANNIEWTLIQDTPT